MPIEDTPSARHGLQPQGVTHESAKAGNRALNMGKYYEVRLTMLEYREDAELTNSEDLIGEAVFAAGVADCIAQVYDGDTKIHEQEVPGEKLLTWLSS